MLKRSLEREDHQVCLAVNWQRSSANAENPTIDMVFIHQIHQDIPVMLCAKPDYNLDSTKALLFFSRKPCDLLFTDLDMPVLNGYHLARLIKKHRPQAKAVAMTSRYQAELVGFMGDGIIDGWLFKPSKLKALSDKLTDIGVGTENCSHQIKRWKLLFDGSAHRQEVSHDRKKRNQQH